MRGNDVDFSYFVSVTAGDQILGKKSFAVHVTVPPTAKRAGVTNGNISQVYAGETRPWLQGARLTMWELVRDKIPAKLIADSAAGRPFNGSPGPAYLPGAHLLVMTMTVFLKFTVRPWPSVSRPSSRTWSRTLNTSR